MNYCAVNLIKIELSAVVKLIISMTHHYKSCPINFRIRVLKFKLLLVINSNH